MTGVARMFFTPKTFRWQSRSSWGVDGLKRRVGLGIAQRATVVGRGRFVEVSNYNLIAQDGSLGSILKSVLSEESACIPVLSHSARDGLSRVDASIRLGRQNLTRDGVDQLNGQGGRRLVNGSNHNRVGVESLSFTSDNNGLARSKTSWDGSDFSVGTDREKPVTSGAVNNDGAGYTRKRSRGHDLDNIACVTLDSNVLALGATQCNNTLVLGIHTLDIEGVARKLGKDRLGPDNLTLVLSAQTIHATTASYKDNKLVEAKGVSVQTLLLADSLATGDAGNEALGERCKVVGKILEVVHVTGDTVDVGLERVGVSLLLQDLGQVLDTRYISPNGSDGSGKTFRTLPVDLAVADHNPVVRLSNSSSSNSKAFSTRFLDNLSNSMNSFNIASRLESPTSHHASKVDVSSVGAGGKGTWAGKVRQLVGLGDFAVLQVGVVNLGLVSSLGSGVDKEVRLRLSEVRRVNDNRNSVGRQLEVLGCLATQNVHLELGKGAISPGKDRSCRVAANKHDVLGSMNIALGANGKVIQSSSGESVESNLGDIGRDLKGNVVGNLTELPNDLTQSAIALSQLENLQILNLALELVVPHVTTSQRIPSLYLGAIRRSNPVFALSSAQETTAIGDIVGNLLTPDNGTVAGVHGADNADVAKCVKEARLV
ncbi:hypothetical protein HG531_002600 [Fusarium graminearum]|nr:hypothetical protein HG531_002600 [Fusarium graminearum]